MTKQIDCDVCDRSFPFGNPKGVTTCDKCQGRGVWYPTKYSEGVTCDKCGGTGDMRCPRCLGSKKIYVPNVNREEDEEEEDEPTQGSGMSGATAIFLFLLVIAVIMGLSHR